MNTHQSPMEVKFCMAEIIYIAQIINNIQFIDIYKQTIQQYILSD